MGRVCQVCQVEQVSGETQKQKYNKVRATWSRLTFCLHIRHFLKSESVGLNRFFLEVSSLFSPTFLEPLLDPGMVLFELPAFQGSGLITLPNFPFFSHFSQTILATRRRLKKWNFQLLAWASYM